MPKHTIKERLEAGLTATGWTKEPSSYARIAGWTKPGNTSRAATRLSIPAWCRVFVGTNGGLRAGRCKLDSHSVQHTAFYAQTLAAGDRALHRFQ